MHSTSMENLHSVSLWCLTPMWSTLPAAHWKQAGSHSPNVGNCGVLKICCNRPSSPCRPGTGKGI